MLRQAAARGHGGLCDGFCGGPCGRAQVYGRLYEEGGARVQSHSWGSPGAAYGVSPPPRTKWTRRVPHPVLIGHAAALSQVSSAAADAFLAERRDAVLVFAAGNAGGGGAGTVGAPANAKNVLAVGATLAGAAAAARVQEQGEALGDAAEVPPPPPLVLSGHAASFTPY